MKGSEYMFFNIENYKIGVIAPHSFIIVFVINILLKLQALMNAVVDCLGVYKTCVSARSGEMIAPNSLKHLPLYILSLLKQVRCLNDRNYVHIKSGKQRTGANVDRLKHK